MFGRRRREETEELLRDARDRVDTNNRQTARLIDAMTVLNATIAAEMERNQHFAITADATVSALQQALSARSGDVSTALEHVAAAYDQLTQRIEADRLDRGALTEAIRELAAAGPRSDGALSEPIRADAPLAEPRRPHVLGGSMFAGPTPGERELACGDTVDLVAEASFEIGTSVCCRFGDQWINGVEIVEAVGNPTRPAYRLRRYKDGYILPALFGARDLRPAQSAVNGNGASKPDRGSNDAPVSNDPPVSNDDRTVNEPRVSNENGAERRSYWARS